jgi:hypothetical protein
MPICHRLNNRSRTRPSERTSRRQVGVALELLAHNRKREPDGGILTLGVYTSAPATILIYDALLIAFFPDVQAVAGGNVPSETSLTFANRPLLLIDTPI